MWIRDSLPVTMPAINSEVTSSKPGSFSQPSTGNLILFFLNINSMMAASLEKET